MKKLILILLLLTACDKNPPSCPFCNDEILKKQRIFENELTSSLYTHKPTTEGHMLIIPKRHVERYEDLTDEEILSIHHTVQKTHAAAQKLLGTKSYLLLQKNGKEVGQTVPHIHIHYIPQKDGAHPLALIWGFMMNPFRRPLSEEVMREKVTSFSEAF
jgi:histidine triad (HIT) family protein